MDGYNDFSGSVTGDSSQRHASLSLLDTRDFLLMGIVNVTPDSFYDGGAHDTFLTACDHARKLLDEGADILDIGGESSRPGALPVSVEDELARVLPVITQLRKETTVPISIDTTKAAVAREALEIGATWINDISAGRFDVEMADLAAQKQCPVILMHSRKRPETMQADPSYADVVSEVLDELRARVTAFTEAGVSRQNIILDPGIGFAKRFEDNIAILKNLERFIETGFPLLIGTSRKSFIGQITEKEVENRLYGTLGSVASAFTRGATLFRVHDVMATRDLLQVLSTIEKADEAGRGNE